MAMASTDGGVRVFVAPWCCGHPDGAWLEGRWPDGEAAQEAADRHVVAYVDGDPSGRPEPP